MNSTTFSPYFAPVRSAPSLPEPWRFWIAENKMLGNPDEEILRVLVSHGLDVHACKRELAIVAAHPYFKAGKNFTDALRKLESHCQIRGQLAQLGKHYQHIERRERVDRTEFVEKYYSTNTPVILTGMMSEWQALTKWRLDFFREQFGEVVVDVQFDRQSNPLYEIEYQKHTRPIKMKDYIDMVAQGGATNDYYMVANNNNFDLPAFQPLFADIVFPSDLFLPEPPKGTVFFWLGPAGTITPLHHDPCNLMMAQVWGRKKWKIIPPWDQPYIYNYRGVFSQVDLTNPDYDRFPLFRNVHIIEEILHPGEIIFMPVGWWHFVESLDISISVSMTHFSLPNSYNWQYPNICR